MLCVIIVVVAAVIAVAIAKLIISQVGCPTTEASGKAFLKK